MSKSVLIVDDSQSIQKALAAVLERHGCRVVATASSGLEAVKKYKEVRPDFVTLDLVMPQMGGLQTLALLKKIDSEAVVIVVSSLTGDENVAECMRAGASQYILKPFDEDGIVKVLQEVVFGAQSSRE